MGAIHDMHMDFRHIWATHIVFFMAPYMGLYFFSNNAAIKIDMNLHKNVIVPIFTTNCVKLHWISQELYK